ncbi:CRISPR-associated RAMP protein Csx10 [Dulcicalothrix desertica PCC 7102]|uniref:CRISPR-associated RAMP protein Csx10 n=1 Tax=Dulcicalothrix desertica PCC 7102 TaxID=232991 RepID=A0A433UXL8_9CYAN|nr:RAMP superfamily CRISPR-associated protein [Dulcicalothrix desertica]RUS98581.1 CRISPR-associated RAMP protein Csx10 [Dulcicalothrix desertica PCC 7102]TWH43088.1 CRISPR-associated protein Csx10 [Dulcicalothrix desertica PCC 7102]
MKAITFSLHTQQPLLATSFQGDPNSDVSYSYIPGSMLRGAIIGRYMKQNRLAELDLASEEVKRLFFDANSTCYLNAYLQSFDGKRTLPIPRSWFKEKDAELTDELHVDVYDFSVNKETPLESPKFFGEGFWSKERGTVKFYKEKRRINIHNWRDRKKGRSTQTKLEEETKQLQGEGEIFRYEAIDSGQTLQAVILCSSDADAKLLTNLLNLSPDIWLGGSQSAGYGYTKITKINYHSNWKEVNIYADTSTERDFFTITLLSDLILRDEYGQYAIISPSTTNQVPAPLIKEIKTILGLNIEMNPYISFTSSVVIGGFNRKWGLPLPQVPALAAGSVFVFDEFSITPEQIQQLETQGIGERRVEGFGRIAVNWLSQPEVKVRKAKKDVALNSPQLKTDEARSLAAQMAERLLVQKIEQALQKFIARTEIKGDISNSQLSRLQIFARKALSNGDCDLVLSLINNIPANAKRQFEKAEVNNTSLNFILDEWLKKPTDWTWVSNKDKLKAQVADAERSFNDEFAIESKLAEKYTLRLIMALAKKATKEKNK